MARQFLLIGGPKHGETITILHGRSVAFPGFSLPRPAIDAQAHDPLPPLYRNDLIYSVWPVIDGANLMKLDSLPDRMAAVMLARLRQGRILSTADKWIATGQAEDDLRAFIETVLPTAAQRARDAAFLAAPYGGAENEQGPPPVKGL